MFADDSKIYFKCQHYTDRQKLFLDVNKVFQWLEVNQLKAAVEKCAVLHLGSSNPCFSYRLNGSELPSVDKMKDIGVLMCNNLKFSDHCSVVVSKAS